MVDAITARCGACSSSIFLFRRCLFARLYCLWLMVARIANSSPYLLLRTKHPPTIPALITFLGLGGIVFSAKLTKTNCKSATRICAVARYPVIADRASPHDRARSTLPPPPYILAPRGRLGLLCVIDDLSLSMPPSLEISPPLGWPWQPRDLAGQALGM